MSNNKGTERNFFGSKLDNYTRVYQQADVIRVTKAALHKGSLHLLFSHLFFKQQQLPLLKICDYVFDAYEDFYGNNALEILSKNLEIFALTLVTTDRDKNLVEDLASFMQFIQMYLETKVATDERVQKAAEITAGSIRKINEKEQDESWLASQQEIVFLVRNAAAISPHNALSLLNAVLSYQQNKIIDLLEKEIIEGKNKLLGQDPF
ncbi:MAG: hypothetical protein QG639_1125 [Patescibacteria group bacterium]|jgi:hypothetical protein|nr:hypothetical protein [Patescibacteria group bacterium]